MKDDLKRRAAERFKVVDIWTGRGRSSPRRRSSNNPEKDALLWPGCSTTV